MHWNTIQINSIVWVNREVPERLEKCIVMKGVSALEYIFYYFHEVLYIESGRITSEWDCVGCRCVTWKGANTEL